MATSIKATGQVELCLRVGGQRATVIAETGSRLRALRLERHLHAAGWDARPIAIGQVAVYAVRDLGEGMADLDALEAQLKRRYRLAMCEPGFSESLYRVAQELAATAEAEFTPVEKCVVCGQPDPFPTLVSVSGPQNGVAVEGVPYCAHCVAASEANTYGKLCRALLVAAGGVFGGLHNARLGRARRKGAILRFPIHPERMASAS